MRSFARACRRVQLSPASLPQSDTSFQRLRLYSTSTTNTDSQTIKLPDGRVMGFSEYGNPNGTPLLYFHGYPSSRLEGVGMDRVACKRNLRVFTLERPGFGISTPQPNRRVVDFVEDVEFFTGYMALKRFAVMGGSGGGPYALACAHQMSRNTMSAVGLFASGGPYDKSWEGIPMRSRCTYLAAKYAPSALGAIGTGAIGTARWALQGPWATSFDAALAKERERQGETLSDKTIEEAREESIQVMFEGFAQGSHAFVEEANVLATRPWGFELEDIDFPVQIWHGEKDTNAPIQWIRNMAKRLPHSRLKEYSGATHYSMLKHLEEVLTELVPESVDGAEDAPK